MGYYSTVGRTKAAEPLPDAFSVNGDSLASVRKSLLSYAIAPLSEQKLKLFDGTTREFSVMVPLVVDPGSIAIDTLIDNKRVRLELDTGGDAGMTLNQPTAAGIMLAHPSQVNLLGIQGSEPATEGIAHSMTLSRGGVPTAENGEAALSVPFRQSSDGQIYLPVHICSQSTWACLDSGAPLNILSLTIAKTAASQVPPKESVSTSTNEKIGPGDTVRGTNLLGLKRPLPILIDQDEAAAFSTTSQVGASFEDFINVEGSEFHQDATLGMPFFLQFHCVIIDYPNHKLILQGRRHGDPLFTSKPGDPWPGYLWQRVGDGLKFPMQAPAVQQANKGFSGFEDSTAVRVN